MPQEHLPWVDLRCIGTQAFDFGVPAAARGTRARTGSRVRNGDPDVTRSTVGIAVGDRHHESHGEHAMAVRFEAGRALNGQGGVSPMWRPGKTKKPCKSLTRKAFGRTGGASGIRTPNLRIMIPSL